MGGQAQSRSDRHRKKQPVTLPGLIKKYWVFLCAALIVVVSTALLYGGMEVAHMSSGDMERVEEEEVARPMDIIEDVNQEVYAEEPAEREAPRAANAYVQPDYTLLNSAGDDLPYSESEVREMADEAVRWATLLLGVDLAGAEVTAEHISENTYREEAYFTMLPQGESVSIDASIECAAKDLVMLSSYESMQPEEGLNETPLTDEQIKAVEKECVKQAVPLMDMLFGDEVRPLNVVNKSLFYQTVQDEPVRDILTLDIYLDNGRSCKLHFLITKDLQPVFCEYGSRDEEQTEGERYNIEQNMPELLW